jgi:hypothetical protein
MRAVGVLCAWGGALLWAIGLAVLQPRYESSGELVGNNAYWMRDARWMAVVAAVAALVLVFRGDRLRTRLSLLGGVAWLAADIWLDRLAIVTGALLSGAVFAGTRKEAGTGRHALLVAASVAAALAPLAGGLESPTDTEPSLTPSALTAGVLLAVVAGACALAGVPASTVVRFRVAVATAVVGVAGVTAMRAMPLENRLLVGVLLGAALLSGVAVTAWPRPAGRGLLGYAVLAAGTLLGYPVLLMSTVMATGFIVPVAAPLTALAGSPAVNGADEDLLFTLVGVLPGLVFGALFTMRAVLAPAPAFPAPAP